MLVTAVVTGSILTAWGSFKADDKRLKGEISAHIASKAAEVEIRVLGYLCPRVHKE